MCNVTKLLTTYMTGGWSDVASSAASAMTPKIDTSAAEAAAQAAADKAAADQAAAKKAADATALNDKLTQAKAEAASRAIRNSLLNKDEELDAEGNPIKKVRTPLLKWVA